ncbi:EamA family transporter [Mycobacterium sp. pW049]|uniref:EamA family transporter n=1 Tax=[Mycobacterium] bulgaricum TaxID=3238985 RepID=UPI00351ADDE9
MADFFGGKVSRGRSTAAVVLISQAAGLVIVLVVAATSGSFAAPTGYLLWAVGAGLSGAAAVFLFYQALSIGTMSIIAPIAALGVIVPVAISVSSGVIPSALCLIGIATAIAGVVIAARGHGTTVRAKRHGVSVVLAIGSAGGFGLLQYAIAGGSSHSTVMTMVVMRCTSVPLLAAATCFAFRAGGHRQSGERFSARIIALIIVIGIFDVSANLMFAEASVSGNLAVVATLGSLYPAATVLLARIFEHEKLSRSQNAGVLGALIGVAMITAAS